MIEFVKEDFFGFEKRVFEFEGRQAVLVLPKKPHAKGKWLLKTEYFGAFPDFELAMLERGAYLAYLKNVTRWHLPCDSEAKARFADLLAREFSLAKKCLPVGMSCGGLQAAHFAARYPEKVAAIYLDAPVMDLRSCPGKNAPPAVCEEFEKATGIAISSLDSYGDHPVSRMVTVAKAGIPVILVAGDSDATVPYEENGKLLEPIFREAGTPLFIHLKKGCDHHPHGLSDMSALIDFANRYYMEAE